MNYKYLFLCIGMIMYTNMHAFTLTDKGFAKFLTLDDMPEDQIIKAFVSGVAKDIPNDQLDNALQQYFDTKPGKDKKPMSPGTRANLKQGIIQKRSALASSYISDSDFADMQSSVFEAIEQQAQEKINKGIALPFVIENIRTYLQQPNGDGTRFTTSQINSLLDMLQKKLASASGKGASSAGSSSSGASSSASTGSGSTASSSAGLIDTPAQLLQQSCLCADVLLGKVLSSIA